jgi:hypothetical protein
MDQEQGKDTILTSDEVAPARSSSAEDKPTAPDQFDDQYRTTQKEIWAYYSCVVYRVGCAEN